MVALVLRLRLAMLVSAPRQRGRARQRAIIGTVLAVLLAAAIIAACVGLYAATAEVAFRMTTLGGAAVTLGFVIVPILAGMDDLLDVRRFLSTGVTAREVIPALLLGSFVSIPTLALVVSAGAVATVWIHHGVTVPLALLWALLAVITTIAAAHVVMAVDAVWLRSRRTRELNRVIGVAVVVAAVPVAGFVLSGLGSPELTGVITAVCTVVAYTPFGAVWAAPAAGAGVAIIAVATLVLLIAAWVFLLVALVRRVDHAAAIREHRRLGWFALTPRTATGVIAARSLIYWFRDPRYLVNLIGVPLALTIIVLPLLLVGVSPAVVALIPPPLIALFLGWLVHNDVAFDSSAIWLHVSTRVRGLADRVGRLVPVLLFGGAVLVVVIPLSIWIAGDESLLPVMIGVCAALFGSALGWSSISSALRPYPAAQPGDGAFEQPQRTTGTVTQAVVLLLSIATSAPVLWRAWLTLSEDAASVDVTLWIGVGLGVGMLLIGVAIGSLVFQWRRPKIMEFAHAA